MKSLIIAFARNRPECLADYLPGSDYMSLRDLLFPETTLEALRASNPDYMVLFDMDFQTELTKDGILQYLAERDEAERPLPFALIFRTPENAVSKGLPAEGENVNLGAEDKPITPRTDFSGMIMVSCECSK